MHKTNSGNNNYFCTTGLGGGIGTGSVGCNPDNPGSGRVRACAEAVLVQHLQQHLLEKIRDCHDEDEMTSAYLKIEMPTQILLANLELNGFGKNTVVCVHQV